MRRTNMKRMDTQSSGRSLTIWSLYLWYVRRITTRGVLIIDNKQVAYQRILQLTYVDELLVALKALFVQLFQPFLSTFVASLHASSTGKVSATDTATTWDFTKAFEKWDKLFDDVLRGLENKAAQVRNQFWVIRSLCSISLSRS